MDDDVEASRDLVGAHLAAHRGGARVTTGYLPASPSAAEGFFAAALRNWWEAMFAAMRRPSHRFCFRDLLTGNCAIDTSLFGRLGGFDPALACHEDWELGFRAIRTSATMAYVEAAAGVHHDGTSVERSVERKVAEGRADIQLVRKHPELLRSLPLVTFCAPPGRRRRLLYHLVFRHQKAAGALSRSALASLRGYEAARMRGRWNKRLYQVLNLGYWQGVALETGTPNRLEALIEGAAQIWSSADMWLRVDLSEGLEHAMELVGRRRPDGLAVVYRGRHVGFVHPSVGAERLLGHHLRAALAQELAWGLLVGLGKEGAAPLEVLDGRLAATGPFPRLPLDLAAEPAASRLPRECAPCEGGAAPPLAGRSSRARERI
jgi:hypothetical protein